MTGYTFNSEKQWWEMILNAPYFNDGEFDRWDRRTLRWFTVSFDCKTREIRVAGI